MESDKKNYSTIMFTKDEHKEELLSILNDSRIQAIMPENIRGKAGKMLLWMARYMKCQLELGLLDEYQKPVTFNDIGALYYRLERSYETWEADLNILAGLIKDYVDEHHLSDTSFPYHFTEEIKDDKILLHLEFSSPEFNFGSLTGLLHKLEMGDCSPIMAVVSDNHVLLSWSITATRAYASALGKWENVHKSFGVEEVSAEDVDPEYPEEDPPGGDIISELEIIDSESSDTSDVIPPTPEEIEYINAEADKIEKIIELYREGKSISELSKDFNRSSSEIYDILRINRVELTDLNKDQDDHRGLKDAVVVAYKTGYEPSEIVSMYSLLDISYLWRILDERKVKYSKRARSWKNRGVDLLMMKAELVRLYKQDYLTVNQILSKFGLSDDGILYSALREAGVPTRKELGKKRNDK